MQSKFVLIASILSGIFCGCTTDSEPESEQVVNLIEPFPQPSASGFQWLTPELQFAPHTEQQWCYVTRYTGEDVAITQADHYQSQHGHHVLLMSTGLDEEEYPDGTLFDCTDLASNIMATFEPIYVVILDGTYSYLRLPDGMAVKMNQDTRIIIQSHYVNTSDSTIKVQDAINVEFAAVDSIAEDKWAAPFAQTIVGFSLPANQESTDGITCGWNDPYNLLYLYGHMHEYGQKFSIDFQRGESLERIYEILEWDPEYRDIPLVDDYGYPGFPILEGDRFTTTCTWFNSTDHVMEFPEEMCAITGMLYPSKVPVICSD